MKELAVKILLISDLHWLTVKIGRQKGQSKEILAWIFERMIDVWKKYNMEWAIPKMLKNISLMFPACDRIICGGDFVECKWNERGITTNRDCDEIKNIREKIQKKGNFCSFLKWNFVSGDHELGYRLSLSSDPEGGISMKSLENFQKVFGPLWQKFVIGELHFMLLSSSLMIQDESHLSKEEGRDIKILRARQREFILDELGDIPEGKTVFIFLHDPDAVEIFYKYLDDYYYVRNKNIQIFCGHMHAEFAMNLYKKIGEIARSNFAKILPAKIRMWAKNSKLKVELFKKYNLQIMPAPGGMMGFGGGFKVMNIYKDGTYDVKKYRT